MFTLQFGGEFETLMDNSLTECVGSPCHDHQDDPPSLPLSPLPRLSDDLDGLLRILLVLWRTGVEELDGVEDPAGVLEAGVANLVGVVEELVGVEDLAGVEEGWC